MENLNKRLQTKKDYLQGMLNQANEIQSEINKFQQTLEQTSQEILRADGAVKEIEDMINTEKENNKNKGK